MPAAPELGEGLEPVGAKCPDEPLSAPPRRSPEQTLRGDRFGRLVAAFPLPGRRSCYGRVWAFRCDCGGWEVKPVPQVRRDDRKGLDVRCGRCISRGPKVGRYTTLRGRIQHQAFGMPCEVREAWWLTTAPGRRGAIFPYYLATMDADAAGTDRILQDDLMEELERLEWPAAISPMTKAEARRLQMDTEAVWSPPDYFTQAYAEEPVLDARDGESTS